MTKIGKSSIRKTIKMFASGSSGDHAQRGDSPNRNERRRYGTGEDEAHEGKTLYRDPHRRISSGDSYGETKFRKNPHDVDRSNVVDEPERGQARKPHAGRHRSNSGGHRFESHRFGGSLERNIPSRRRFHSGESSRFGYEMNHPGRDIHYDIPPLGRERPGRRYGHSADGRFPPNVQGHPRESYRVAGHFRDQSREGRFSPERYQSREGRFSPERYQSREGRFSPERYQSREGRFSPERYGISRHGHGDRFIDNRFSHGPPRYGRQQQRFDQGRDYFAHDQSGRIRFGSGRPDEGRMNYPQDKFGPPPRDMKRGAYAEVNPARQRRPQSMHPDFDHPDSRYQTEGISNANRRFEPFGQERRPQRISFKGQRERDERGYEMQGGSKYQGGGQYGCQFATDRMPPPVPPFSEARTNYPTTLALKDEEEGATTGQGGNNGCRELAVRAAYDLMRRRYYERSGDPAQNPTWLQRGAASNSYDPAVVPPEVLRVEQVDFRAAENSKESRTFEYELVRDAEHPTPVLRRGDTFVMTLCFFEREFDASRDKIYLNFYFGPNPSVPKKTRVVLPIGPGSEFERVPHQWDVRIRNQEANTITVQVSIPATCPVGMWRCVVETATSKDHQSRLQFRCSDDIYILFNPFCRDDSVYMENDSQRFEYVINETGKVYTGGYRNVRGRPWIYGQFDDCVLPAACLLLEMSGLSHAERGNPAKFAKALASMVRAARSSQRPSLFWESTGQGLIEARHSNDYTGGNSPHTWTGSVQIIEEFLRGGATPVKYAQCWVISSLMTTLCRSLGLPSRSVTSYVNAVNSQDTLTVDRYVDRFGDLIENGPGRDQPDSLWAFHTWCDVWMARPDQPQGYSGWQATDPCRVYRDYRDLFSGSCGPCPIEALRRGDVGQREDVDVFYASLNSYVRYFYEDEHSGWGFSPFRQFRYPISRYILTKAVGRYDDEGDTDCDDVTNVYRDNERSDADRFNLFNSCRGIRKDTPAFEYQAASLSSGPFNPNSNDQTNFDVSFELDSPDKCMVGEPLVVPVVISNNSSEPRNVQLNICTRSTFYTGVLGSYLKRSNTQFALVPNQHETITLTLDPWDYVDKLSDMSFIKITVSAFVQETQQSFIDEFDFRFNKPRLNIDVPEIVVGSESEATFTFTNPLDIPLTDCFLTMEVSGSVRPRTIRIDREVRPHEPFTFSQSFVPRHAGEKRLVATFVSRQLQDVVGQRPVVIRE